MEYIRTRYTISNVDSFSSWGQYEYRMIGLVVLVFQVKITINQNDLGFRPGSELPGRAVGLLSPHRSLILCRLI